MTIATECTCRKKWKQ